MRARSLILIFKTYQKARSDPNPSQTYLKFSKFNPLPLVEDPAELWRGWGRVRVGVNKRI
jgi:hypothetical protein